MGDLFRLEALANKFVSMCATLLPFKKFGGFLYLCCEKIHSMLHSASEIMRWGSSERKLRGLIRSMSRDLENGIELVAGVKSHTISVVVETATLAGVL